MATILPLVPSIPSYRVSTSLNSVRYLLDVRWNARDAAWYMDVLAQDETPIAVGIKLVLGVNLGRRCTGDLFTSGTFVIYDTSGSGLDAGLDDLGTRVLVAYYSLTTLLTSGAG